MSDMFYISKQKYNIFKYIYNPDKRHPLKFILCEALFRNTILELYSTFFDTTGKIPKSIIPKFIDKIKENNGNFISEWDIPIVDADSGITRIQTIRQSNNFNTIILDVDTIREDLKFYRDKVLSHKDHVEDYSFGLDSLCQLVEASERIICALLKVIEPNVSRSLSGVKDKEIEMLFKILSGEIHLTTSQLEVLYPKLV